MMAKQHTMQKLADLARQKLEIMGRELAQLQQQCKGAEDKLALLIHYHQDYQNRLGQQGGQGMSAANVQEFQRFLKQLDQVIQLQRVEVERHRRFCQEALQRWLLVRREMKGFEKLGERHVAQQHLAELQKSQKDMDEFASRTRHLLGQLA